MKRDGLNRRDFNRLTMAAFGGVVAGSMVGCGGKTETEETGLPSQTPEGDNGQKSSLADVPNDWKPSDDIHICRGLNACKGKGVDGSGDKPGTGGCATVAKHHSCHAENDCKYQGGCQESVGQNSCKGLGECGVPLSEKSWAKAREAFEKAMQTAGTEFGDAPPNPEKS